MLYVTTVPDGTSRSLGRGTGEVLALLQQLVHALSRDPEELRWARDLAERGGHHLACFLAQQVAEKALKGFLYAQGEKIVLGHSVERLCAQAAERDAGFTEMRERWAILDGFYVPTRYPNSLPGSIPAHVYTREAADEAVALAEEAVRFVEERVPPAAS